MKSMNRPAKSRREPDAEPRRGDVREPDPAAEPTRKQIYLRTLYPLNPGIPHYLDNPTGW